MSNVTPKASLDTLGIAILSLLVKTIGYSKHPKAVPLVYIQRMMKCSQKQVRLRIKKLKVAGVLESWTTKHPTHFKVTYYRLPYLPSFFKEINIKK